MRNRKLWVSILAGVMAAILVLSLVAGVLPQLIQEADGASIGTLKNELEQLKEQKKEIDKQIAEYQKVIDANTKDMKALVAKKNAIDQQIFMLHEKVANINEQIVAYSTLIADKQDELNQAQSRLDALNKKYRERVRAMEEQGSLSYWYVLFKANSFTDLLDRMSMIQEIAAADERRLQEMSKAAEAVNEAKEALEIERQALETSRAELEESQKELDAKRLEADQLLQQLVAVDEEYKAYMAAAKQEAKEKQEEIDDVKDEITKKEWEEQQANKPSSGNSSSKPNDTNDYYVESNATWVKPCKYKKLTSPFGWRVHPVHKDWRFHYGVDLAGSAGTPIVAARGGTIKTAKYSSSAGYYVEINHGDGFSSQYMHMTHYIVKPGQTVKQGDVIGYMGSTGTSTGNHLHFSILYKGDHVNPAKYLKL